MVSFDPIRMKGHRQTALATLWFLLFALAACATRPPEQVEVEKAVELRKGRTLDVFPPAGAASFQASPFGELVNRTFLEGGDAGPHFVNIMNHGDDALIARIHLIRAARKTVHLQTFIWGDDEASLYVLREMLMAARRGVKVKVIIDQLGITGEGKLAPFLAVDHVNMEVKIYNPTAEKLKTSKPELAGAAAHDFIQFNRRMHNKVLIVDNRIAITGGRNIENKYFDLDPKYTFKDRDIVVVGPVVNDMTESFLEYWTYDKSVLLHQLDDLGARILEIESDSPLKELIESPVNPKLREFDDKSSDDEYIEHMFVSKAIEVEGKVAFFADAPTKTEGGSDSGGLTSTKGGLKDTVLEAKESLVMQTPYLLLSKSALGHFKKLRKALPDFRIIASTNSLASADHLFVYAVGLKQRHRLVKKLKFQIYELKPEPGDVREMVTRFDRLAAEKSGLNEEPDESELVRTEGPTVGIHAKSYVVDDEIACIGSHNFDPRSNNLNTEAVLMIWDKKVADALKEDILRDIAPQNSWVLAKRRKVPILGMLGGILETISRGLPVFDIWPLYYTTSYELRSGEAPVPPDHPDFRIRYEAIGPFPGVHGSTKAIQSRLATALGGWAAPLM